jgi:hypothetical protein
MGTPRHCAAGEFETNELRSPLSAYLFLTNVPYHRMLDKPLHTALVAFGLGIPDFSKPGSYRLSDIYRRKRKHIDAHDIIDSFAKYPQLPITFDDSLPSESLDGIPPIKMGETYAFEGMPTHDGILVATVTSATVLEPEKKAYIGVTDQNGCSHILTQPMTDGQLADYRAHPEAYFGKLQYVGEGVSNPYDLFEFFMKSYKDLSRAALVERLAGYLDANALAAMTDEDLRAVYCEGLVAGSKIFGQPSPATST